MADSDEFEATLLQAAGRTDALRATGLEGLEGLTQARQGALERERGRLTQKLGADHSRVKVMALRMEDGAARLRDLGVEIGRAKMVAPPLGPAEWAIHGYVLWKDLSPAPDMTVSLVDAQGQWLRPLGYACTDAHGYFRLVAKVERPQDGTGAAVGAHVRVTDADRKELYRDQAPSAVTPGAVEYREIVLEAGGRACAPPDGEDIPVPSPGPRASKPSPAAQSKGSTRARPHASRKRA